MGSAAQDESSARQTHEHSGGAAWPWPYTAEQRITLAPEGAVIEFGMTSLADKPVPAGLGLHPYFPCTPATSLAFLAERAWLTDADMLRTDPAPPDTFGDWSGGAPVGGTTLIDNTFFRLGQPRERDAGQFHDSA